METNPLERLSQLEQKIGLLIELIHQEKATNARLAEEKNALSLKLESMENSLMKESKSIEELQQERQLTKMAVDDLISSIDKLVEEQRVTSVSSTASL